MNNHSRRLSRPPMLAIIPAGLAEMCGPQTTTAGSIQGMETAQLQWN
jgi:hypothetical protein